MAKRPLRSDILIPLPFVQNDVEPVRFERNILQIGFFGAQDVRRGKKSKRRFEQTVTKNGQRVQGAVEFRSSEDLGLPTIPDQDKFLAFMRIAGEQRAATGGILSNTIQFSGYRLLLEMGMTPSGANYDEILPWGKRMVDTSITTERMVYFAKHKEYSDKTIHVFRSFERIGRSDLNGAKRKEAYEVVLEDWLIDNLNQGYVVPEDFNSYKQLQRPTAKGIFGHLHIWFHASGGKPVEKDYQDLCNLLNIQTYPHLSKIKEKMGVSLDELVNIGYLSAWDIQPMISKSGFKLVLSVGDTLRRTIGEMTRKALPAASKSMIDRKFTQHEQNSMDIMTELGISDLKARELINQYDALELMNLADYIQSLKAKDTRGRIENPAGLLIYHLDNGLQTPPGYVSLSRRLAQQAERESADQQVADEDRKYSEYSAWKDIQIEAEISRRFPGEALAAKLAEIRDAHKMDMYFKRASAAGKTEIAMQLLRKEVLKDCNIPAYADMPRK